ncbi:MAG: GTPase, partial [Pseudomonadota bacterium]
MSFTLALIGRPNVGKSTLFNRLVGKRLALVDDRPGVTRDLREGEARLGALRFRVVDTAGLEDAPEESLAGRMRGLSERAVDAADAVLFMIDARVGVTAADQLFAEMLRKRAKVVLLGANKAEGHAGRDGALEAYGLGLGEPVLISAEHGEGMIDLAEALAPLVETADAASQEAITDLVVQEDGSAEDAPERPMQIAVIGRPNAGKSTLVNRILGEDRLLTGP